MKVYQATIKLKIQGDLNPEKVAFLIKEQWDQSAAADEGDILTVLAVTEVNE